LKLSILSILTYKYQFPTAELQNFKEELSKVESLRKDGKFRAADGSVLEGDDIIADLVNRCNSLANKLSAG
jgi:hypothetical protein